MSNIAVNDLELSDVMELLFKKTMLSMNCHAIGEIQSFDKDTQTCTATISYSKKFIETNQLTGEEVTRLVKYPTLVDVPVSMAQGGEAGLSMPIKKGDGCIILFNDRDIDNWYSGKKTGEVNSSRLHSMSDAMAIVGLRSEKEFLSFYDDVRASLFNGTTRVAVGQDKILIENSTHTLNNLLQELITEIKALTVGSTPVDAPSQIAIGLVATKIGELLE